MKNIDVIRNRYLQYDLQLRLGGLSANLARIVSFSNNPDNWKVVNRLFEESKYFIEWTVPEISLELQAKLVELQIKLAGWQKAYTDPLKRKSIVNLIQYWSDYLLQISGLLNNKEEEETFRCQVSEDRYFGSRCSVFGVRISEQDMGK